MILKTLFYCLSVVYVDSLLISLLFFVWINNGILNDKNIHNWTKSFEVKQLEHKTINKKRNED